MINPNKVNPLKDIENQYFLNTLLNYNFYGDEEKNFIKERIGDENFRTISLMNNLLIGSKTLNDFWKSFETISSTAPTVSKFDNKFLKGIDDLVSSPIFQKILENTSKPFVIYSASVLGEKANTELEKIGIPIKTLRDEFINSYNRNFLGNVFVKLLELAGFGTRVGLTSKLISYTPLSGIISKSIEKTGLALEPLIEKYPKIASLLFGTDDAYKIVEGLINNIVNLNIASLADVENVKQIPLSVLQATSLGFVFGFLHNRNLLQQLIGSSSVFGLLDFITNKDIESAAASAIAGTIFPLMLTPLSFTRIYLNSLSEFKNRLIEVSKNNGLKEVPRFIKDSFDVYFKRFIDKEPLKEFYIEVSEGYKKQLFDITKIKLEKALNENNSILFKRNITKLKELIKNVFFDISKDIKASKIDINNSIGVVGDYRTPGSIKFSVKDYSREFIDENSYLIIRAADKIFKQRSVLEIRNLEDITSFSPEFISQKINKYYNALGSPIGEFTIKLTIDIPQKLSLKDINSISKRILENKDYATVFQKQDDKYGIDFVALFLENNPQEIKNFIDKVNNYRNFIEKDLNIKNTNLSGKIVNAVLIGQDGHLSYESFYQLSKEKTSSLFELSKTFEKLESIFENVKNEIITKFNDDNFVDSITSKVLSESVLIDITDKNVILTTRKYVKDVLDGIANVFNSEEPFNAISIASYIEGKRGNQSLDPIERYESFINRLGEELYQKLSKYGIKDSKIYEHYKDFAKTFIDRVISSIEDVGTYRTLLTYLNENFRNIFNKKLEIIKNEFESYDDGISFIKNSKNLEEALKNLETDSYKNQFIDFSDAVLMLADLPDINGKKLFNVFAVLRNIAKEFDIKIYRKYKVYGTQQASGIQIGKDTAIINQGHFTALVEETLHSVFKKTGLEDVVNFLYSKSSDFNKEINKLFLNSEYIYGRSVESYDVKNIPAEALPAYFFEYLLFKDVVFYKYPQLTTLMTKYFGKSFDFLLKNFDLLRDTLALYKYSKDPRIDPEQRAYFAKEFARLHSTYQDISVINRLTNPSLGRALSNSIIKFYNQLIEKTKTFWRRAVNFEGLIRDTLGPNTDEILKNLSGIPNLTTKDLFKYSRAFIESADAFIKQKGIPLEITEENIIKILTYQIPEQVKNIQTLDIKDLLKIISNPDSEYSQYFSTYLLMKSIVERKRIDPDYKSPYSVEYAEEYIKTTEAKYPEFEQLAEKVDKIYKINLQLLKIINPDIKIEELLNRKFYSHLFRLGNFAADDFVFSEKSIGRVYRMIGSYRPDIIDPLFSLLNTIEFLPLKFYRAAINTLLKHAFIKKIEKNKIVISPYLVDKDGNVIVARIKRPPKVITKTIQDEKLKEFAEEDAKEYGKSIIELIFLVKRPDDIYTIQVSKDKKIFLEFKNKDLKNFFIFHNEFQRENSLKKLLDVIAAYTGFKKYLATNTNIAWSIINIPRDIFEIYFTRGSSLIPGKETVYNGFLRLIGLIKNEKDGLIKNIWDFHRNKILLKDLNIESIENVLNKYTNKTPKQTISKLKQFFELFSKIAEISEESSRYGVFNSYLQDKEITPENVWEARKLSFEKTHYWPTRGIPQTTLQDVVNFLDKTIPFFRARIIAKKDSLKRSLGIEENKIDTKFLLTNLMKASLVGALISVILKAGSNDEKYKNLPWWRKTAFINIPAGDKFIPIPIEHPLMLLSNFVSQYIVFEKEFRPEISRLLQGIGLVGIDELNSLLYGVVPFDVLKPVVEVMANRSMYNFREIEPEYYRNKNIESVMRGEERSTEIGKALSKLLNKIKIKISPIQADYLLGQYFVSLFQYYQLIENGIKQTFGDNTSKISKTTIVQRFLRDYYTPSYWYGLQKFKSIHDDYEKYYNTYLELLKYSETKANEYYKDNGEKIEFYLKYLKYPYQTIQSLISSYYDVYYSENYDEEIKNNVLENIQQDISQFIKDFNEMLSSVKLP